MFRSAVLASLNRIAGKMVEFLGDGFAIRQFRVEEDRDVALSRVVYRGKDAVISVHDLEVKKLHTEEELLELMKPRLVRARDRLIRAEVCGGFQEILKSPPLSNPFLGPNQPLHTLLNRLLPRVRELMPEGWILEPFVKVPFCEKANSCIRRFGEDLSMSLKVMVYRQEALKQRTEEELVQFVLGEIQGAIEEAEIFSGPLRKAAEEKAVPVSPEAWSGDGKPVEVKTAKLDPIPYIWPDAKSDSMPYKMSTKEIRESAEVMRLAADGHPVECRRWGTNDKWCPVKMPFWNWAQFQYRLAPVQDVVRRWLVIDGGSSDQQVFEEKKDADVYLSNCDGGRMIELHGVEQVEWKFQHLKHWALIGKVGGEERTYLFLDREPADRSGKNLESPSLVELNGVRAIRQ